MSFFTDIKMIDFFEKAISRGKFIGGVIGVAINKTTGYLSEGLYKIVKCNNSYRLKCVHGGNEITTQFYEKLIFDDETIERVEFNEDFGEYANIYLKGFNGFIHIHMSWLD